MVRIKSVVTGPLSVNIQNSFSQFSIGQIFMFRLLFPASFNSALYICVNKKTEWVPLPQNVVRTPAYNYAV